MSILMQGVFLKTATVSDDFFLCEPAIKQQIVSSVGGINVECFIQEGVGR